MQSVVDLIFSNSETLTPGTIVEFFVLVCVIEFLGMMFSWINGRRY